MPSSHWNVRFNEDGVFDRSLNAVRIEELLNYFQYEYDPPTSDQREPLATHVAVAQCPWNPQHRLARVALKGRVIEQAQRPASNLVLLIDSWCSMKKPNKLPLLKRGLQLRLKQLDARDRIAVVVYAGSAGLILDSTPATESDTILAAFARLEAGGSTNGGAGLQLVYDIARDNFIAGGTNRILLCTDGDFNVEATGTDQVIEMVERESKAGIDLTVPGFGMGNLNDSMLEQISGRGNGNHAFIDTFNEARKVLADQLAGADNRNTTTNHAVYLHRCAGASLANTLRIAASETCENERGLGQIDRLQR